MSAVLLFDPKYPHNVGQAVRACSCFGIDTLLIYGNRVELEGEKKKGYRLPREERMRGRYKVDIVPTSKPFDNFPDLTPVAVELVPGAVPLPWFQHPADALYVMGPEDGTLPAWVLRHCHHIVSLPMDHCANLASALYITLYDGHCKDVLSGVTPPRGLDALV